MAKYYSLTTYKNSKQTNFWDFYTTLTQARKDAKQCIKDGSHEVVIAEESNNFPRWKDIEHHYPFNGKIISESI